MSKADKERFVTGFSGSTIEDVSLVIFTVHLATVIAAHAARAVSRPGPQYAIELAIVGLITILSQTVLSEHLYIVHAGLLLFAALSLASPLSVSGDAVLNSEHSYVTCGRAAVMLQTIVAILAVDFHAFPRRFAKTETFGVSLMDVGVGQFVFIHGFTAAFGVHKRRSQGTSTKSPILRRVRKALPVLLLGLLRIAAVTAVGYQEHVTEYGTHWNFFLTIAVLQIIGPWLTFSELEAAGTETIANGAAILIAYQAYLSLAGGTNYILEHPRNNFIHANREGLLGLLGFTSLYCLSCATGRLFRQYSGLFQICTIVGALSVLAFVTDSLVQPISRRMVNASFCAWMLALGAANMAVFRLLHYLFPTVLARTLAPSGLVHCINSQMFFVFLLANLVTGGVNMSINTLATSDPLAVLVLMAYLTLVCGVAYAVQTRQTRHNNRLSRE